MNGTPHSPVDVVRVTVDVVGVTVDVVAVLVLKHLKEGGIPVEEIEN